MEFIKCCPKCESRKTGILSVTRKEIFIAQQTTNVVVITEICNSCCYIKDTIHYLYEDEAE